MKKVGLIYLVAVAFFLSCGVGIGYIWGKQKQDEKQAADTLEQLAVQLEALIEWEKGNVGDAKRMLQISSSNRFDLMRGWVSRKSGGKFECAVMRRYADYYRRSKIFVGDEWADLLSVPDIRETVKVRETYIRNELPLLCPARK